MCSGTVYTVDPDRNGAFFGFPEENFLHASDRGVNPSGFLDHLPDSVNSYRTVPAKTPLSHLLPHHQRIELPVSIWNALSPYGGSGDFHPFGAVSRFGKGAVQIVIPLLEHVRARSGKDL